MSTDSFNLAPAQSPTGATITAPAPAPEAPDQAAPKKTKKTAPTPPGTPADGTLAGVVIPGAALTALISLCWLTHQYGLPAVIAGVIACALAASAALVAKTRRGTRSVRDARKNALRNVSGGGGGSGGGGRHRSGASGGSLFGGASRTAKSGGGPGAAPRSGKGPAAASGLRSSGGGRGGSSAALKPAGLNTPKRPTPGLAKPKATTKTPVPGSGRGGVKNQLPKQTSRTAAAGFGSAGSKPGNRLNRSGTGNTSKTSAGHLGRIRDRKTPTPTPGSAAGIPTTGLKKFKNGPKQETPTRPLSRTEKKQNRAHERAAKRNNQAATDLGKTVRHTAKQRKIEEGPRRHRRTKDRLHKTATKVEQIKQHQQNKAELKESRADLRRLRMLRIKNAANRIRTTTHRITTPISRAAAHTWRIGTRLFTQAHMVLGSIRYTDLGPNWARPLLKLAHAITTPVARLIHATGSWNWLNLWMYRNTTPQGEPKLKPVSPMAVATAIARNNRRATIHSPAATAPKGTPSMSSDLSGAMPLVHAADAVRAAGIMLLINPADNMHGYEATIRQLSDIQSAISQVIRAAAESTRENFAVNPVISDAYDDTAAYGHSLAERLDAIPVLFRMVHAEQLENLENPTPQAAKWDIGQNLPE